MTSVDFRLDSPWAGIDTATEFRAAMAGATHCLPGLSEVCLRPVIYSRHHWLRYKGEYRVRADLRSALESVVSRGPVAWDDDEADLVLTLLALDMAGVGLDELTDRADSAAVRETLLERYVLYAGVVDPAGKAPSALLDLAARVADMRPVVQETHEPYSVIDGRAWYRTEGLIPRDELDASTLTEEVEHAVAEWHDAPAGTSSDERLRGAARRSVEKNGHSAPVVRAIMRAALADPVLQADHVTLTCPMGDMLDRPQDMTTSGAFFTETQLRDDVRLADYAERLGHESDDQLQRTIKARMLKLKRGAIRSLYGAGCLQGKFVEKHGGHMIFRNEDAHYRGHQSIGCSSGGRASFAVRYRNGGVDHEMTPMVGDFRVVRMTHDERLTFDASELRHVISYAEWIRTVVEETYRLGAVVRLGD